MKHLCYSKGLFMLTLLLSLFSTKTLADERYAFIYNNNINDRFINFYEKVVVNADIVDNIYALRYPKKMVAYVSVGEIEPWRKGQVKHNKSWVISKNKTWDSLIADLSNQEYQSFLFQRITSYYKKGYKNFFLDTMDSYHVTHKNKKQFQEQQNALVSFMHQLRKKYPKAKIITNRGFELLDKIHQDIDAVVAESLISGYNHATKSYTTVSKEDQTWLLDNFSKAKEYGLDTIAIDYSNKNTQERINIAKEIQALGIIPYVTDGLLQDQGECQVERIRRDILILFNQSNSKDKKSVSSEGHLLLSMPLEHMGYVPILYDIATKELPSRVEDRYHSVIVYSSGQTKNNKHMYEWAKMVKNKKLKILFFNNFIFTPTPEKLNTFGLLYKKNHNKFIDKSKVTYHPPYHAYEISASIEHGDQLIYNTEGKSVLSLHYDNGESSTPIAITPWGGYAIGNSFSLNIGEDNHWTINPFMFLKDALKLDTFPVPDLTTEAGRRMLFVHIDGDGFMEPVRTNMKLFSAEAIIEKTLKKYPIPHTVSIIQGEVDSIGLYPKLSAKLTKIVKELYTIPWIQPASHTLSHPFHWDDAVKEENKHSNKYHLPLPNYTFSLQKETIGSVDFACSLAPKSKRKEKIIFWSGDCLPTQETLAYIERQGILSMNGGDTTIQKAYPWLTRIAPNGLQHNDYWQIYTAQQNENMYTNEWLGPFWGFRNVIETFKMTNEPYRVKPINIYYHLYAGSKVASHHALNEVYDWAMKQKTSKLYTSEYIKKGQDYYHTAMGKIGNSYEVKNSGHLRTMRIDKKINVDIQNSQGVAGFIHHGERTYITLDKRNRHLITLTNSAIEVPYLIDSNGWVETFEQHHNNYKFLLKSNVGLEANFHLPTSCQLNLLQNIKITKKGNILSILAPKKKGVHLEFKCQQ